MMKHLIFNPNMFDLHQKLLLVSDKEYKTVGVTTIENAVKDIKEACDKHNIDVLDLYGNYIINDEIFDKMTLFSKQLKIVRH